MGDVNMHIGLYLGQGLESAPLALPAPLVDVERRAQFIVEIDKPLLFDSAGVAQWAELGDGLRNIGALSSEVMPELIDPLDRVAVALRLWAGCIMAAKAIAFESRSGPNTETARTEAFGEIDRLAAADPLFNAGVEAAPVFKKARGQGYCLEGVPSESAVRRHA